MDDSLEARRLAIEQEFQKLGEQKTEIEREQYRLQGEYRVISDLMEQQKKEKKSKKVSPEANVIDATGTEGA